MQILIILSLTILQFFSGFGILSLLRVYLKPSLLICISVLLGVAVFSFVPFLLQLVYIQSTLVDIFCSLMVVCLLLNLKSKKRLTLLANDLKSYRFTLRLYEVPFLLLIAFIVFVSAWRCFYFPPTPRDLTSGAEVIAEYAVKEKTMINSVFTVDLSTTNNQFKPPFITSLQIIYKYAGFPFGQVWLTTIFICFLTFLYHVMKLRLHKIIAGLLLVMFIAIPEMYAYTIMALFDYSNSVFLCLSLYFLFEHFNNRQKNCLVFSGILMAIATYIRSETLILAAFMSASIVFHYRKQKNHLKNIISDGLYFLLPSAFIYFLSITVYVNYYLPSTYNIDGLLNKNLSDPSPFFKRLNEMTGQLLLAGNSVNFYGYFVYIFSLILSISTFYKNAWNRSSLNWLFAVLVIYIGIPFLGYLFPLYDLDNSTKRGLFKIFPLMLLFMVNSRFLISASEKIRKWEVGA